MTSTHYSKTPHNSFELIVLASLSGLLYSSWPLGYWLNLAANRGLASNLEGIGQPYNWLFISLDLVSGLIVAFVGRMLYRALRLSRKSVLGLAVINYGLFGVLTFTDALIPVDCAADQKQCGQLLDHPWVLWHGVISIISIGCLTVSLLAIWWLVRRAKRSPRWLHRLLDVGLATWVFFGTATAILLLLDRSSALSQHIFIIACSLWTGILPYVVRHQHILAVDRSGLGLKKISLVKFWR